MPVESGTNHSAATSRKPIAFRFVHEDLWPEGINFRLYQCDVEEVTVMNRHDRVLILVQCGPYLLQLGRKG